MEPFIKIDDFNPLVERFRQWLKYMYGINAIKKSNGIKTVPQIFVGDHHLGGNAELQTLEKEGRLNSLLGI